MKNKTFLVIVTIALNYSCSSNGNSTKSTNQSADDFKVKNIDTTISIDTTIDLTPTLVQSSPNDYIESGDVGVQPVKEIVNLRVQNTYVGTDKTYPCFITIDEESKIMTLEARNGVDTFKMIFEGDGTFKIHFYNLDGWQATQTIYRRPDLEDQPVTQVYTTRTGEITFTLSYQ